jgi:hypothetical protein
VTLTIQTEPALANVRFAVDGQPVTTDANGRAQFTQEHDFAEHTLMLFDISMNAPGRRYHFARWAGQRDPDQAFRPTVTGLPMRASYTITAAYRVQFPVHARIVDGTGAPVDPAQISAITLKRDDGSLLDYPRGTTADSPLWLDGQDPTYRKSALRLDPVSYAVQGIVMNGVNVIDSGKQRFAPAATGQPAFVVPFHDLTVRAHDALFANPLGTSAMVTYPDGRVRTVAFGADHTAVFDTLPRGEYRVDIVTKAGIVLSRQLRLSRGTAVDLVVVSHADLAAVVGGLLALACGLILIGRARRLRDRFAGPLGAVWAWRQALWRAANSQVRARWGRA